MPRHSIGSFSLLDAVRLALAILGIPLLTLTVFGSLAWNGTIAIFALQDQAHLISLMTSAGLAVCAFLSQIVGQMARFRYGYVATFTIVVATAIAYFFWASWPIAIYYKYFDLSNVFALYTSIAFGPALIVSISVIRARAGSIALASFATLGALVLYVTFRDNRTRGEPWRAGHQLNPRMSWQEIFSRGSKTMPPWYAGSLLESDRSFWDGANGEGFYDWYPKHQVESAYAVATASPEPMRAPSSQPMLAGLESGGYYAIE